MIIGTPCLWCSPHREQLSDRVDETPFGEGLHEEGVGAGLVGARLDRENAENEHDCLAQIGIAFDRSAERQSVEFRDEHLGDDDVRTDLASNLERGQSVGSEFYGKACLIEEIGFQLTDMRIPLDDENEGPSAALRGRDIKRLGCVRHSWPCWCAFRGRESNIRRGQVGRQGAMLGRVSNGRSSGLAGASRPASAFPADHAAANYRRDNETLIPNLE